MESILPEWLDEYRDPIPMIRDRLWMGDLACGLTKVAYASLRKEPYGFFWVNFFP